MSQPFESARNERSSARADTIFHFAVHTKMIMKWNKMDDREREKPRIAFIIENNNNDDEIELQCLQIFPIFHRTNL